MTTACRRSRGRRTSAAVILATAVLVGGGCSGTDTQADSRPAAPEPSASVAPTSGSVAPTSDSATPAADPTPTSTRRLDSIAVLGHSGATGTLSDPTKPWRDAHENSWATGSNPRVASIYRRLLADHPAMKGHHDNGAVNGTTVDDLAQQFEALVADTDLLPDVILIQTIDNDMRCDGSDAENYGPFGRSLDGALTEMERAIPDVQFFLVSQWATVEAWTAWAAHHEQQVQANSGTGPCAVFTARGKPRPSGIRTMQEIVDGYWAQVEQVCAAHPGCFTDGGAEQRRFVPTDDDVAADLNHLSIAGHRKFADIAWQAFPDEIKQRP